MSQKIRKSAKHFFPIVGLRVKHGGHVSVTVNKKCVM